MVSFTSIVALSLLAVSQVVQGAPGQAPLPQCQETFQYNMQTAVNKDHFKTGESVFQFVDRFPHEGQTTPVTVERVQTPTSNGKAITTITTPTALWEGQFVVRVTWFDSNGKTPVNRFFQLSMDQVCRVRWSADYKQLSDAVFILPGQK